MKEKQIRVDMSTVHSTGGYHIHSAHVKRSDIVAVMLEALADVATDAARATPHDAKEALLALDRLACFAANWEANRVPDAPDTIPIASARELADAVPPFLSNASGGPAMTSTSFVGDLKVGGDVVPDTIPADSVRQLMDGLRVWTIRHWNDLPQNVREDWGYMVAEHYAALHGVSFDPVTPEELRAMDDKLAPETVPAEPVRELVDLEDEWFAEVDGRSADEWVDLEGRLHGARAKVKDSLPPRAPHGTVDAHLAEQMKDAAFREQYLREALKMVAAEVARLVADWIAEGCPVKPTLEPKD
ncbi:MAG TPA: hypothetical protein VM537_02435 [Anaerolineae bacterium]|nr:hypothetical protein [Anaerolineae bacterium]